ncbi:MAG: hypothetical protein AB7G48_05545 [Nitrospiraceae bacterium]
MKCARCHGLMIEDHLLDIRESLGPLWIKSWRCVACGNIVDPLILKHRTAQASQVSRLVIVDVPEQQPEVEVAPPAVGMPA